MPERVQPGSKSDKPDLQAEILRLNKIIRALMDRAERNASLQGSDFNLFQTAITLEDQVRSRTVELENASRENEKITRTLLERENNYRLLLDNSPVSIHEIGSDGRIVYMSRAGLVMHEVEEECEIQGTLYMDGVGEADRGRVAQLLDKAYTGEISHFEFAGSGSQGRIFTSCFVPIKDGNGHVQKLMGITEDITERKALQTQVIRAQRLESLAQLSAGIAHHFNNIDVVILGYLGIIARNPDFPPSLRPLLDELGESVQSEVVTIHLDLNRTSPVQANRTILSFLLSTFISNSRHALVDRPTREITVSTRELSEFSCLEVSDTGCGIREEDKSRIFSPFFTTKGEWATRGAPQMKVRGIGLSLAVCRSLVNEGGGKIEIDSTEGVGTRFRALFPVAIGASRIST
ncbi:MAG TPA: ATP-binding protein [Spirochaetia bacterium]|nr:ATP-binding protein [Spirochaetia bacterium]